MIAEGSSMTADRSASSADHSSNSAKHSNQSAHCRSSTARQSARMDKRLARTDDCSVRAPYPPIFLGVQGLPCFFDRSHAGASLPLSYGFPVCKHWSARFILPVFSIACFMCKINLALQFGLNLMTLTLERGNQQIPFHSIRADYKLLLFLSRI